MARVTIGRNLDEEKLRAEEQIDRFYRAMAANAVFYTRKTVEARRVLAGERSELIEGEARMKGVHRRVLAAQIDGLARAEDQRELARIAAKQEIRKAESKEAIHGILTRLGVR